MDTIASFFCLYEVINHEVLTKLHVQMTISIALVSMVLLEHGKNLITHGIADKAPYLSKAITLCVLFLSYCSFSYTINYM